MGETLKKERNITWQPYLPNDAKQDITEIYERLDVDRQGFITQQRLHAALNEAYGKPIRTETVRTLAARMDITSRHGLKVSYNDFMEYMAQKLLSAESYEDLLRSEQGPLMQEVGYKLYELLERFKRKQMLKDAMAGGDGIQRLLHLTTVPMAHRNRRKGQSGIDLHSEARAKGAKGGAGSSARGKPRAGAGPGGTGVDGGTGSRAIGDTSVASRSSLVSRHSSGGVVEVSTSLPAAGMRAGNSRSAGGGRPPCSRPSRNSAPAAARASSALASFLGRTEGHDPDIGPGLLVIEDRRTSPRWRKSTSHLAEELQHQLQYSGSLAGQAVGQPQIHAREQQQQLQQLEEVDPTGHIAGGPATLTVIRPRSSNPSAPSSHFSTHLARPSQPSSSQVAAGLLSLGSAPASGDGGAGIWPSRRLASHTSASVVASAPLSNPFGRNSEVTPSIPVPSSGGGSGGSSGGGSVSRASSPAALGPLGLATGASGQPLLASPLGGARAEGWRSAALMAQVLEVERLDVHSQVMEDLRATVGLSTIPSPACGQLKSHHQQHLHQQQQPQLLLQGQVAHQHQQPHLLLQSLSSSVPLQQQHRIPASTTLAQGGLQPRSLSFPQQSSIQQEEVVPDMDGPPAGSNAEFCQGELGPFARNQRAESYTHVSQSPPSPHLPPMQQQQQRLSATPRHSQTQPPQARRPHSQPAPSQQLLQQPQSQQHNGSNTERRREGGPVGTWVTSDPEGVLGQLLRGSLSSGGQPRNGRPRFQAVSAADALRLDVPGPIESDPLLAKLPDWVRKGIGLSPAPAVQPVEPEPGSQHVAVAPAEPPLASSSNGEPAAEVDAAGDGGGADRQHVIDSSRGVCGGVTQEDGLEGVDAGAGSGEPHGAVDGGGGGGTPRLAAMRGYSLRHSMTRFLPFGGDVAAVVAEEENEEQNSEPPPQVLALGNDGSGGDGPAAPPAPPAAVMPAWGEKQGLAVCNGDRAAAAPWHIHDPLVSDASCRAPVIGHGPSSAGVPPTAVGHQLELLTPGPFAYGKYMSAWPGGGAADGAATGDGRAVDGDEPDAAAVDGLNRDVELPIRESLTAWEASVLSRQSRVGHGMVQPGEDKEEEEGERDAKAEDGERMAICKQLTGNSGIGEARTARRASMVEPLEHPTSAVLQHTRHLSSRHPNLRTHCEQQEPQPPPRRGEPEPLTQMQASLAGPGESEGHHETRSSSDTDVAADAMDRQGVDVRHGSNSQDTSLGGDHTATSEASGCSGSGGHVSPRCPASQPFPQATKTQRQPFYMGSRPHSAALLPSAAAVVAAAEAAAASNISDIGSGGLWSADYVGEGVAASGRPPAVRLNHTVMLRLQAQYGSELVASAGAALGLGGSSAAARDVASREVLQTLIANGSGRVTPLSPPTARSGASGAYVPAARAAQAQRCRSSSSNHGTAAAGGTLQPRTSSGGAAFLPHDAVGLGREISRQASRRVSSESGAGSSGALGARPASARPALPYDGAAASAAAVPHGPMRRPASALPPRNPASQNAIRLPTSNAAGALPASGPARARSQQAPTSSHPDPGRAFAQAVVNAAAAVGQAPPAWGDASSNRRPPGRSASALAPTSHIPPTISIGRVRQLEHSEVSSCFTALPVASGCGAGSATASAAAASEVGGARNAVRPFQLPPPGSPVSTTGLGVGLSCLASGPPRSPALKEGPLGGTPVGRRTASAGSSSSGGRGHFGTLATADGTGAGEQRRRRALEVMGTGALVGTGAGSRKGSAGSRVAVAGSGDTVVGGPRVVGAVAREK